MQVLQAMNVSFVSVRPTTPVAQTAELVIEKNAQLVVVENAERVLGFVRATELDKAFPDDPISILAEPHPRCVPPSADVRDARAAMMQLGVSALPVIERGRVVGVITADTLRRIGIFPNEPGVDRCAACGASNDLVHERGSEIVFCRECLDQVRGPGVRPYYFTLGGGD